MKIASSTVTTDTSRMYQSIETVQLNVGQAKFAQVGKGDQLVSSTDRDKMLNDVMNLLADGEDEKAEETVDDLAKKTTETLKEQLAANQTKHSTGLQVEDQYTAKIKLLREMLRLFFGNKGSSKSVDLSTELMQKQNANVMQLVGQRIGETTAAGKGTWVREVSASRFFAETESVSYSTVGTAITEDGRQLDFTISMEMSRSFSEYTNLDWSEEVVFCDPLVINLDNNPTELSDQQFYFDLDNNGEKEEISMLKKGSGYLALDKNDDGEINDGGELFGAKTGNGFAELNAYDGDSNGWIDENDEIFDQLKVWIKDDAGNNQLLSLKDAGVGAIYLGSASTDFTHRSGSTGEVLGQTRRTGFYLKEDGQAGSVQQVDLSV